MISVGIVALMAMLIFAIWFPSGLRQLGGGTELFWLIASVDAVCGPLLTLIVFNPAKKSDELRRDLTLVALIQLLALGYGIETLTYARPLAVVHEVDRFRVVTFSDLDESDAHNLPSWAQRWRLSGPRTVGLRAVKTSSEKLASIDASLQGIEPSQRPSWWQDYSLVTTQVLQRAYPLTALQVKQPGQQVEVKKAAARAATNWQAGETNDPNALVWLPLVSRRRTDWVVLIDPVTARLRGYIAVDGF